MSTNRSIEGKMLDLLKDIQKNIRKITGRKFKDEDFRKLGEVLEGWIWNPNDETFIEKRNRIRLEIFWKDVEELYMEDIDELVNSIKSLVALRDENEREFNNVIKLYKDPKAAKEPKQQIIREAVDICIEIEDKYAIKPHLILKDWLNEPKDEKQKQHNIDVIVNELLLNVEAARQKGYVGFTEVDDKKMNETRNMIRIPNSQLNQILRNIDRLAALQQQYQKLVPGKDLVSEIEREVSRLPKSDHVQAKAATSASLPTRGIKKEAFMEHLRDVEWELQHTMEKSKQFHIPGRARGVTLLRQFHENRVHAQLAKPKPGQGLGQAQQQQKPQLKAGDTKEKPKQLKGVDTKEKPKPPAKKP